MNEWSVPDFKHPIVDTKPVMKPSFYGAYEGYDRTGHPILYNTPVLSIQSNWQSPAILLFHWPHFRQFAGYEKRLWGGLSFAMLQLCWRIWKVMIAGLGRSMNIFLHQERILKVIGFRWQFYGRVCKHRDLCNPRLAVPCTAKCKTGAMGILLRTTHYARTLHEIK